MGGATRASPSAAAWSALPGRAKPLHVTDVLENPGTSHEHLRTSPHFPGWPFYYQKGTNCVSGGQDGGIITKGSGNLPW